MGVSFANDDHGGGGGRCFSTHFKCAKQMECCSLCILLDRLPLLWTAVSHDARPKGCMWIIFTGQGLVPTTEVPWSEHYVSHFTLLRNSIQVSVLQTNILPIFNVFWSLTRASYVNLCNLWDECFAAPNFHCLSGFLLLPYDSPENQKIISSGSLNFRL